MGAECCQLERRLSPIAVERW